MTDYTREIRLRHTSTDRHRDLQLFWPEFDQSVQLRETIRSVTENEMDPITAREYIRRNYVRPAKGIETLLQTLESAEAPFPVRLYRSIEILQAAAVASCDLIQRNKISLRLAEAAVIAGNWERAKQAIAEAMEGLHIFKRFFVDEEHLIVQIEEGLKTGWKSEAASHENSNDVFDPASNDPSNEWIDLILWNSDKEVENPLVGQSDATIRLAIRFDYWLNQRKLSLEPVISAMHERCETRTGMAIEPARCLLTIANALMEVREWQLASGIHQKIQASVNNQNILGVHARIQSAHCHLQTGNMDLSRTALSGLHLTFLHNKARSDRVATCELARYTSVYSRQEKGQASPDRAQKTIQYLMQKASSLVNWRQGSENRSAYLKNLHYSILVRDLLAATEGPFQNSIK